MSIEQLDAAIAAPVGGVVLTVPANTAIGSGLGVRDRLVVLGPA
jgi:hypothetical protein